MRPAPIEPSQVWEGGVRRTIVAPDGDPTNPEVAPVDVIIDMATTGQLDGAVRFNVCWQLEEGDLEALRERGRLWVTIYGRQLPVHSVSVEEVS